MIGLRIKKVRQANGLTLEMLAKKLKVSRQTLSKYENGIIINIPSDKIETLARALNTTPAYLMGWEDENNKIYDNIEPMPRFKSVPLIGTIACGAPITAQENVEDDIPLPDYIHADFCLICKGDSMINARIFDGDIVFIKQQPQVENGEIAAVLIDEEATLKRVFKLPHSMVELRAENPTYPSIYINGVNTQTIKIIGKAVHFLSKVK